VDTRASKESNLFQGEIQAFHDTNPDRNNEHIWKFIPAIPDLHIIISNLIGFGNWEAGGLPALATDLSPLLVSLPPEVNPD
jgi:hypothetical protein